MAKNETSTSSSTSSTSTLREVTVLGAGVMGAAIAAHMANAGLRVRLLDIVPKDAPPAGGGPDARRARNKVADAGLDAARKAKPAAFFSPRFEALVSTGNLEDDLAEAVANSDFVIEAIVENLAIKQKLYARIDELGGQAIITSNTSGLRIADLMQGRSESFRRRFCITHFFNPPRYLKLVEIVAGPDTATATLERAEALTGTLLGKGLVRAKDTPNFIANRIGTFAMMRTLDAAVKQGYTVEEVDMIFGPNTGRPKSAVFRTADVVGLDTLVHVTQNCYDALPGDERREVFAPPDVLKKLVERKWLGSKTKQGFYKKVGNDILQLDLATLEYGPQKKPRFASIGAARGADDPDEKIRRILDGDDRASALTRTVMYETFIYAANRLGEIADDIVEIDRALRWGFGWERGPFETWDALGVKATAAKMEAAGYTVPGWVKEQIAAQGEGMRFYKQEGGKRLQLGGRGGFGPIPENPRHLSLAAVRAAGGELERNGSASLLDLGDGVFCLEFHAKMNAIDPEIVMMTMKAVDRAEREGVALVIGNDAPEAFCAGANLFGLMVAIGQKDMKGIEEMVAGFQNACMRTRYARVPVVAAPFGLALGGGAEVIMGCQTVRAAAELYVGCVEVGVGLIPAGGGCMEMAARAAAKVPADDPTFDLLSLIKPAFFNLATAKVATSAEEARDLGYLRPGDSVSMTRETLIADAKELALGLSRAGYRPPPPRRIRVVGEAGAATVRMSLRSLVGAHQISEHDAKISNQLARILSGGSVPAGALVSEQHLLDLEREAFLSLCGEPKTQERIQAMLTTSKPLRN